MDALEKSHPIKKSLSTYMRRYPAQNAKTEDLWNVLSQSQFLLSGQHGKWVVPITLSIGSYERQKKFLLETSQGRVDICCLLRKYTKLHK
ncbi:hypothetical protein JHK86_017499 [Glycine max]|nr:hypothetical protein JHK86_017499 [Glycine max]